MDLVIIELNCLLVNYLLIACSSWLFDTELEIESKLDVLLWMPELELFLVPGEYWRVVVSNGDPDEQKVSSLNSRF